MTNQVVAAPLAQDEKAFNEKFMQLELGEIGLSEADQSQVLAVVKEYQSLDTVKVGGFGKNLGAVAAEYTDNLLTLVKNKDLDETGAKLTKVVQVAQTINANNLLNRKPSMLGQVMSKIFGLKQSWDRQFDSASEQIDTLIGEVESTQSGLSKRLIGMESMFGAVQNEYKQLGIYIAAGELKKEDLKAELAYWVDQPETQETVQKVYDVNALINSLEKRTSDLRVLQQSTAQTLPMIRIIQSNNIMLIEKFDSIKNITIPAWKKQISLALSLNEQKNGIALANEIDDATNEILKRNADLLHQNSVSAAKANQRSVIDISTLEHVQNKLIQTTNDVIEIQKNGMVEREQAFAKLKQLQSNMAVLMIDDARNKS